MIGPTTEIEQLTSYRVINNTDEAIPPHAAVHIAEANTDGVYLGEKPTADNSTEVVFNSADEIAVGQEGICYAAPVLRAALDDADTIPSVGDDRGTAADDWFLREGKSGFRVLSATTDGRFAQVFCRSSQSRGAHIVRIPDPVTTDAEGLLTGVYIQDFSGLPVTHADGEEVLLYLVE